MLPILYNIIESRHVLLCCATVYLKSSQYTYNRSFDWSILTHIGQGHIHKHSNRHGVVAHEKLHLKLHQYGIRGNTLKWLKDFLDNQTQTDVRGLSKKFVD